MAPNNNNNHEKDSAGDYYEKGSDQIAQVTAVQLKKLEQRRRLTRTSDRMVICLVGLPGRGKSFIARKLQTFLTWRGNECKVFNVGKYRRQVQADFVAAEKKAKEAEHNKNNTDDSKHNIRNTIGACDADFFDSKNPKAAGLREQAASLALNEMLDWLDVVDEQKNVQTEKIPVEMWASKASIQRSRIAIFDATNSTQERRRWVLEECTSATKRKDKITGCIFVESVCDDQELLEENFRFKVNNSPDFKGMTEDEAIADLRKRVQKYEEQYETIDDDSISYIKVFNLSSKLLVNHIYGRMAKVIVPSLMSWNIGSRAIYLCRSGHTDRGGNINDASPTAVPLKPRKITRGEILGPKGLHFRNCLEDYIMAEGNEFAKIKSKAMAFAPLKKDTGTSLTGISSLPSLSSSIASNTGSTSNGHGNPFSCHIMTSTMPRAVQTATWDKLPFPIEELPNLNPLDKGDFTGMELEEIKDKHPQWYAMLEKDPFLTRFPGGECYGDLIHRLETCIIDMEQQVNMVAVVSHVSVIQVLMSYFRRTPIDKCTSNEVPMNTVIKFTPVSGGGWTESQHRLCHSLTDDIHSESGSEDASHDERPPPIWGDTSHSRNNSMNTGKSFFCC
jgi:broad specificity phosphatase PhoE